MDGIIKIAGIAMVSAISAIAIRKQTPELALVLTICAGVFIAMMCMGAMSSIVGFISDISKAANISQEVISPLIKTVGISVVTKLASDSCADSGSAMLASVVELAGSTAAVVISLPLLMSVLDLVMSV